MKKIMLNDKFGLTQAVLEGRKTMTRRIVPTRILEDCVVVGEVALKSTYEIGEVVAVAQSYNDAGLSEDTIIYRADKAHDGYRMSKAVKEKGWTNKMFVSPNLMPHRIRITDVDVERLQEISDEDCLKEGIFYDYGEDVDGSEISYFDFVGNNGNGFDTPREAFAALIDKVSGRGTWDSNPWVFAYGFELIR